MSTYLQFQASNAPLLFTDAQNCAALWKRLRQRFPKAYAAVLLPDGGHLLVPDDHKEIAHYRLQIALRFLFPSVIWKSPLPPLTRIGAARTLSTLRHILHQPVVNGFCETPCSWNWSSSLDLIGAIGSPWMTTESIETHLDSPRHNFRNQLFNYLKVKDNVSFEPEPPPAFDWKSQRFFAAEVLAAMALSARKTPFQILKNDRLSKALQLWPKSGVVAKETQRQNLLNHSERRCLITPALRTISPLMAAHSALSIETGNSGRVLLSQASTTAGVASSKRGWTMDRVV